MLGLGRALGETMTVLMATGNASELPTGFLDSIRTITATIAIEMGEVPYQTTHYFALFAICSRFVPDHARYQPARGILCQPLTEVSRMIRKVRYALNWILLTASVVLVCFFLGVILVDIFSKGWPALSWKFITEFPKDGMTTGGILPAIVGYHVADIHHHAVLHPFRSGVCRVPE